MDKQTIDTVISTAIANAKVALDTDTQALLTHKDLHVLNLENFNDFRARFRGKFTTNSIKDFCKYTAESGTASIFTDTEELKAPEFNLNAVAIFNLGTRELAGHCDDTARVKLMRTAIFAQVFKVENNNLDQREAAEWIEDWNHNITGIGENGEILTPKQIANAFRNITTKVNREANSTESNMASARSAFEKIEMQSAEKSPEKIIVRGAPFHGLKERDIELRVSYLTGEKPKIILKWPKKQFALEEIQQEFAELIKAELGALYPVYLGSFYKFD